MHRWATVHVISKLIFTALFPNALPPIKSFSSSPFGCNLTERPFAKHQGGIQQLAAMAENICRLTAVDTIAIAVQSKYIAASDRATGSKVERGAFLMRTRMALLPLKIKAECRYSFLFGGLQLGQI